MVLQRYSSEETDSIPEVDSHSNQSRAFKRLQANNINWKLTGGVAMAAVVAATGVTVAQSAMHAENTQKEKQVSQSLADQKTDESANSEQTENKKTDTSSQATATVVQPIQKANEQAALSTAVGQQTATHHATASKAAYTVKAGDTLWQIAQDYHTTVDALKQTNGLISNLIQVNQELTIPTAHATDQDAAQSQTVIVNSGDTLAAIADAHETSVETIRSENHLDSNVIHPGQKLALADAVVSLPQTGAADESRLAQSGVMLMSVALMLTAAVLHGAGKREIDTLELATAKLNYKLSTRH